MVSFIPLNQTVWSAESCLHSSRDVFGQKLLLAILEVRPWAWRYGRMVNSYPLVMTNIAIENGPIEIVYLPKLKLVIFSI